MAKREKFSIGKIVRPDANPEDVEEVGAVGNAIRYPIEQGRREKLKGLMDSSAFAEGLKPDRDVGEDYEEMFPEHFEQVIPREKLSPAPEAWNFFGRPSPEQYALIFQSVYRYGLWHPITVWEQENGNYMILGGHTRDLVYDELYQMTGDKKYLQIPCKVYKQGQISEVTARRIIILGNIAQRAQESPKLRIRCYCEMARLEKREAFYGSGIDINAAVAKLFGTSRATVSFYRKLETLIAPLVDALEKNVISRQAAAILSGFPESLQQYFFEKDYHHHLSSSCLGQLKKAKSEADLDRLFQPSSQPQLHMTYRYVFSTNLEKPKNFDHILLYVNRDDMGEFRTLLREALEKNAKISEGTKKIVSKMLS